jgi:hypothetical protein
MQLLRDPSPFRAHCGLLRSGSLGSQLFGDRVKRVVLSLLMKDQPTGQHRSQDDEHRTVVGEWRLVAEQGTYLLFV